MAKRSPCIQRWNVAEDEALMKMRKVDKLTWEVIGERLGRDLWACRRHYTDLNTKEKRNART